jgi:hypothetical protein
MQLPDNYIYKKKNPEIKGSEVSVFGKIFHKAITGLPTDMPSYLGKGGQAIHAMLNPTITKANPYGLPDWAKDKEGNYMDDNAGGLVENTKRDENANIHGDVDPQEEEQKMTKGDDPFPMSRSDEQAISRSRGMGVNKKPHVPIAHHRSDEATIADMARMIEAHERKRNSANPIKHSTGDTSGYY